MSRPWMPLYIGDYLRDTADLTTEQHGAYLLLIMHCWQHERLPDGERERSIIARLSVKKWRAIRAPIEIHFRPDGTQKRIETEIERTERKILQRQLAGQKGGHRSGITRAIQAATKQRSKCEAKTNHALVKQPRTNHNRIDNLSSQYSAASARAEPPQEVAEEGKKTVASQHLAQNLRARGWSP